MVVDKTIYDTVAGGGTDDSDTPSTSVFIQTDDTNLDTVEYIGSINLDLSVKNTFEHKDLLSQTIFAGIIRDVTNGPQNVVYGFDYGIELGTIPVRDNYKDVTPIEIIQDIITNYSTLTFQNDGVSTSLTIPLYPTGDKTAGQVIADMHKLLGSTHYTDTSKVYHLEYNGAELNTDVIFENTVNCSIPEGWLQDSSNLVESIIVNGDNKRIEESETLSGTGAQTTFTIANPFVDIAVFVGGVKQEPEIDGIKVGDYQIFKETAEIVFNSPPASGTDNILVNYVYELPVNFEIPPVVPFTTDNPYNVTITRDYLKEVPECEEYATKYKQRFENPIRSATLLYSGVDYTQFRAGQRIRVIDNFNKIEGNFINDTFLIKKVERIFGGGNVQIKVTVSDDTEFVFNRQTEIEDRITDFNSSNPTPTIFNVGIPLTTGNNIQVDMSTDPDVAVATLPSNILVYDANRQYVNEADHITPNDNFIYINEADYEALFDPESETRVTEDGDTRVIEDGDTRVTE